ncbi:hypothetical protein [Bosea minatitlanensis]|uniref:Uncharacterized protein n=1 Tax=Bosea minatitlanensis TaxID=128782 RepID=A0ABW0F0H3_9HYPH|nr:hypothetical protein [Bosea minatitlanensis]MCT4492710.1 hypothetical protein [Bosea minatitlanensis]
MTASLTGFAKVPPFDKCFPPKVEKKGVVSEIEAMFASLGAEVRKSA